MNIHILKAKYVSLAERRGVVIREKMTTNLSPCGKGYELLKSNLTLEFYIRWLLFQEHT